MNISRCASTVAVSALLLVLLVACERDETLSQTTAPAMAAAESAPDGALPLGERVYQQACASCHEGGVARAPHRMFMEMMAADVILASLQDGVMTQQAAGLSTREREAVAELLAGHTLAEARAADAAIVYCDDERMAFDPSRSATLAGWGMRPGNQRHIPYEVAGLEAGQLSGLELRWAFAFPKANRIRSQPTVALGAVFIGSQNGAVYALDQATGCVRWRYRASAEVRTPVIVGEFSEVDGAGDERNGQTANAVPRAWFADLNANVHAVDALTGESVWSIKVDEHPNATITGAPVLHGDRLYVPVSSLEVTSAADPAYPCCSFRGSLMALDAHTGEVLWKTYTIDEPPALFGHTAVGTPILGPSGAPIWNSPTLDVQRGMIYAGTGQNYSSPADDRSDALLAFDMNTGELVWHRQKTEGDAWNVACMLEDTTNCPEEDGPDVDFGAATIIAHDRDGRALLLAGQKSGDVYALDLERRGALVWHRKVGRGGIQGGVHFGMAVDGQTLYVPISDMTNPVAEVHLHDVASLAGIYALDVGTGEPLWSHPADDVCDGREFCEAGISAAITAIDGAVLAGHMDGRLRAYAAADGELLWEYDSTKPVSATDGSMAHGGSFGGGAGPVVKDGMLFAASGYGMYFHMPGHVLLAFGLPPAPADENVAGRR
jgi:polyvinyl alcohol dehydrogenase (cytochrome)